MNILLAILALSLMIIFHEFGHFIVARMNGIRVKEFSIGLGPRLLGIKKGETDFCVKLLPFGGACVMQGDIDDDTKDEQYDESKSFNSKSVWARISVILAGPIFNFILAFIFAVVIIGELGYSPAKVYAVSEDSVAFKAGLRTGDVITKVNGRTISSDAEYSTYTLVYPDRKMNVTYVRDGKKYKTTFTPKKVSGKAYRVGISISGDPVTIADVVADSPAKKAGVKSGDVIYAINGTEVKAVSDVSDLISKKEGAECSFVVLRDNEKVELAITPNIVDYEEMQTGLTVWSEYIKGNPLETLKYSFHEVRFSIATVFDSFHMLFTGKATADDVSGPVGIVNVISDSVETGKEAGVKFMFLTLFNWVVLLSANLGVMNLLPIPALDGGRFVFLLIEAVRGKPVDKEKEGMVHLIGMALLMVLMVVVLFNDIRHIFIK